MRDSSAPAVPHKLRESIALTAECLLAVRATEQYAAQQPGAGNKDLRESVPQRPHPPGSHWSPLPHERRSQLDYVNPDELLAALAVLAATSPAWRTADPRSHPGITFRPEPLQTTPRGLPSPR